MEFLLYIILPIQCLRLQSLFQNGPYRDLIGTNFSQKQRPYRDQFVDNFRKIETLCVGDALFVLRFTKAEIQLLFVLTALSYNFLKIRDQIEKIETIQGPEFQDFAHLVPIRDQCLKQGPSQRHCVPPFTKTVKLCSSFNFQLEKCFAPPSIHL